MGVSVNMDIMVTLIFRRALSHGISALVPKDASVSFDLVEKESILRLLDVVHIIFIAIGVFVPFHTLWVENARGGHLGNVQICAFYALRSRPSNALQSN
jgi:hypothetical protein